MSEKVGHGRPPVSGQIKKGEVRNPKGRPKKQPAKTSMSAFDVVIDRTLTITRGGQPREVTLEEALQHRTYQDALSGNRPARRELLKMIAKREKFLANRRPPTKHSIELLAEEDPTNAHEALLLLGIVCRDPAFKDDDRGYERLKLEPWAVQLALGRRKGGDRLSAKEFSEIRRCTLDPEKLRWPRRLADD